MNEIINQRALLLTAMEDRRLVTFKADACFENKPEYYVLEVETLYPWSSPEELKARLCPKSFIDEPEDYGKWLNNYGKWLNINESPIELVPGPSLKDIRDKIVDTITQAQVNNHDSYAVDDIMKLIKEYRGLK